MRIAPVFVVVIALEVASSVCCLRADDRGPGVSAASSNQFESLRLALVDLTETFGAGYPKGQEFLERLSALDKAGRAGDRSVAEKLAELRSQALLANPLLEFDQLV
ncbi:MAG: hypothetical protein QGF59_30445, partial [Pirellulaceae bacterium]|nr:hypothetical protein [Pirellulaceae bacterium]